MSTPEEAVLTAFTVYAEQSARRVAGVMLRALQGGTPTGGVSRLAESIRFPATVARRDVARAAWAMYRLYAALRTGVTVGVDGRTRVTYATLLAEFERAVGKKLPIRLPAGSVPVRRADNPERVAKMLRQTDLSWMPGFGKKLEKTAEKYPTTGVDGTVLEERERNRDSALAALSGQLVKNAGRDVVSRSPKVKGGQRWARVSTTGSPCAFCAMLMSRLNEYRSAESASVTADGDPYHANCHCIAVPVFSSADLSLPMFDMNHKAADMWKRYRVPTKQRGDYLMNNSLYEFRRAWEGRAEGARLARNRREERVKAIRAEQLERRKARHAAAVQRRKDRRKQKKRNVA